MKKRILCTTGRFAVAAVLLAAAAGALYLPAMHHGYVFDDALFVSGNPVIQRGLSVEGLRWAFASLTTGYWHPLTWLSHMADTEIFGLDPGPRHAQGILLHAANAVLLALLLCRLTGAFWRSVVAAALFALHPLNVETVAWTAERKGVLAGFLWLSVLVAYTRAARRPSPHPHLPVIGLFALALMAKPSVVTLPLVLVALDGWPLGGLSARGRQGQPWSLLAGKAPLFALAAAIGVLTLFSAKPALPSLAVLPLDTRLKNAVVSVATYVVKAAWPSALAVHYPLSPEGPPVLAWVFALLGLTAMTVVAVRERRRRPWLAAGWSWYLITLLPVAGIVQLGFYARTDRYTYLPLIGVFVMIAWTAAELLARARQGFAAGLVAAAVTLLGLAATTRIQVGHWKNEPALYTHALEVTEANWLAHYGLAEALRKRGIFAEALPHYRDALRLNPGSWEICNNLALTLGELGDQAGAHRFLQEAFRLRQRAGISAAR